MLIEKPFVCRAYINDKPINIQLTLFIGSNKSQFITFERFPGFFQSWGLSIVSIIALILWYKDKQTSVNWQI